MVLMISVQGRQSANNLEKVHRKNAVTLMLGTILVGEQFKMLMTDKTHRTVHQDNDSVINILNDLRLKPS